MTCFEIWKLPPTQVSSGEALFNRHCSICHINNGGSGIPDLRKMSEQTHAEFLDIVIDGVRAEKGMSGFSGVLSSHNAELIHMYLIDLAWKSYGKHTQ